MGYNRIRLTPEQRKTLIIRAGIEEALEKGLYRFSITTLSRRMENCSKSTIKGYFTLSQLRVAIVKNAIKHNHPSYQSLRQEAQIMGDYV